MQFGKDLPGEKTGGERREAGEQNCTADPSAAVHVNRSGR